jgi:hypothetical protein
MDTNTATVVTAIATSVAAIAALITAIILACQTLTFTGAAKANALAARIRRLITSKGPK